MKFKISALHIYPLKSGKGIQLKKTLLGRTGFQFDRQWMLVDAAGKFLTQRTKPEICGFSFDPVTQPGRILCNYMDGETFSFPTSGLHGSTIPVTIWGDSFNAVSYPNQINQWFSENLGSFSRLVHITETMKRTVYKSSINQEIPVNFPDGYPLLLISASSVQEINRHLMTPVTADRFRANIIVDGGHPYDEDDWQSVSIGEIIMENAKPCTRCKVINVEQNTGVQGNEPYAALLKYRKFSDGIHFGINLVHRGLGELNVGDELQIIKHRN